MGQLVPLHAGAAGTPGATGATGAAGAGVPVLSARAVERLDAAAIAAIPDHEVAPVGTVQAESNWTHSA
jgi:hypothetical protein